MARCDDLVSRYRADLELTGYPRTRHHWQLAALLQSQSVIEVEVADTLRSFAFIRSDGVHDITLSSLEPEERLVEVLLEEIGHAVMDAPGKHLLRLGAGPNLLNDDRDELLARKFVLAWKLPLELFDCFLEAREDVVENSGCTGEEIRERNIHLGRNWY